MIYGCALTNGLQSISKPRLQVGRLCLLFFLLRFQQVPHGRPSGIVPVQSFLLLFRLSWHLKSGERNAFYSLELGDICQLLFIDEKNLQHVRQSDRTLVYLPFLCHVLRLPLADGELGGGDDLAHGAPSMKQHPYDLDDHDAAEQDDEHCPDRLQHHVGYIYGDHGVNVGGGAARFVSDVVLLSPGHGDGEGLAVCLHQEQGHHENGVDHEETEDHLDVGFRLHAMQR